MLTVGSLFAGIGGFDLGLERTGGFEIKWQVEIDPYCQRVLEKHWPHVQRYRDIRDICGSPLRANDGRCAECGRPDFVPHVDVLCGGFPCQPVSLAGGRLGQADERWLWPEFERIIRLVRPRYVLVENTPGLLSLGMGDVLGSLAASGYDAEWGIISASDMGAPHLRERLWIIAYPVRQRHRRPTTAEQPAHHKERNHSAYRQVRRSITDSLKSARKDANADSAGLSIATCPELRIVFSQTATSAWREFSGAVTAGRHQWATEPNVGRVAHGVPSRVDRLKGLGNAVVPQIVEWIGNRILEAEKGGPSLGDNK